MGRVSDHLQSLIEKQVADHGVVVWYDPERHYQGFTTQLVVADCPVVRYQGSFFALRREVDGLLGGTEPPRLVVYVPLDPAETREALVELEAMGVVLKPGQNPYQRNTKLSVVARGALKLELGTEELASIEKQVEAGQLSLEDLDSLGDGTAGRGVLAILFGSGSPQDIALDFVASERHDAAITERKALPELEGLLEQHFELKLTPAAPLGEIRRRLARHVLVTEFMTLAMGELPLPIASLKIAADEAAREACVRLAKEWRLRHDCRESYKAAASRVAEDLGLTSQDLSCLDDMLEALLEGVDASVPETFFAAEEALQRSVVERLLQAAEGEGEATPEELQKLVEVAGARQSSFWSDVSPDLQARWALLRAAAEVVSLARRVDAELKESSPSVEEIIKAYTRPEAPWSRLDTAFRHLERRYHDLDMPDDEGTRRLSLLVTRARERYTRAASALAEAFLRGYRAARFSVPGLLRQTQIFEERVKPAVREGKTAYIWVDALRFEMARELAGHLAGEYDVDLKPAIASVPTITEIGMASLLPCHGQSLAVEGAGKGKLGLRIGETLLKDRKDRVGYLKQHAGCIVLDAKLDDFFPTPGKKLRDAVRHAELVLVTSQEIDQFGEEDNIPWARRFMDDVLRHLVRLFRILAELGVGKIVVAADHRYLFGEEAGPDMRFDAPGGEIADLHRRVWIGRGGAASEDYLRAGVADFGLGGALELATPWGLGCFKVKGGASAYFHGGLSPQEILVPVMVLTPRKRAAPSARFTEASWTLTPGSQKVSTRFFSVQVAGKAREILVVAAPRVRLELRAGAKCVSIPVSASYGFDEATGDVELRLSADKPQEIDPNTVTLRITEEAPQMLVSLVLLDATSGAELKRLEDIEVAIAI